MTAKNTTDVVVRGPFQVTHNGVDYRGGDRVSVPDLVAKHWHRNGWADLVDRPAESASGTEEADAGDGDTDESDQAESKPRSRGRR